MYRIFFRTALLQTPSFIQRMRLMLHVPSSARLQNMIGCAWRLVSPKQRVPHDPCRHGSHRSSTVRAHGKTLAPWSRLHGRRAASKRRWCGVASHTSRKGRHSLPPRMLGQPRRATPARRQQRRQPQAAAQKVEGKPVVQFSGKERARETAPSCGDYLARLLLTNESGGNRIGLACLIQPESFDVRVRRDALCLCCRLDLLDLHGSWLCVSAPPRAED